MNRTTRLRPVSAKRQREEVAYKPIRLAALERAEHSCQVSAWPEVACRWPLHVHHVVSRARAPREWLDLDGLLVACSTHHAAIHADPALATERGYMRSAS